MAAKKMNPRLILILIIVLLIIIFSLQNSADVQLKLFFWSINIPMVLLILGSMIFGVIIGLLFPARGKKLDKHSGSSDH